MAEDTGGLLGFLGRGYDPAAAYGGLLSEPSTEDAFKARALAAMAGAFGRGALPSPYKGGTPFLATLGQAAEAAYGGQDELIKARNLASESLLRGTQADVARQNLTLNRGLLQARLDQLKAEEAAGGGGVGGPGAATGVTGGPGGVLSKSDPNVANNNFAGMRAPGVSGGGPVSNPAGWQKFDTPEAGLDAIGKQLDRYATGKTTGTPLTTLAQIVTTWAPPSENDTKTLLSRASKVTGFAPDQPLDMGDPSTKAKVVEALIRNEHGGQMPAAVTPEAMASVFKTPTPHVFAGPTAASSAGGAPPAMPPSLIADVPDYSGALGSPLEAKPPPSAIPPVTSIPGGTNGIVPAGAPVGPQSLLGPRPPPSASGPSAPAGGLLGPQIPEAVAALARQADPRLAQLAGPGAADPAAPPGPPSGAPNLVAGGGARPPIAPVVTGAMPPMPASLLAQSGPAGPPSAPAAAPPMPGPPPGAGMPPMPVQPQPGTAAPALPGGAPTQQQIIAAKRVAAIQEAMGRPVDPITAKIANFNIEAAQAGANAAQTAAAQQPYTQGNAAYDAQVKAQYQVWVDRMKPREIRPGAIDIDPVTGQTRYNPAVVEGTDPKTGDKFHYHSYPSMTPGGVPTLVPIMQSGIGPGTTQTLTQTAAAQPITVGNQVMQKGPGYTEPITTPAGSTIPPASTATPISGPKDYLADRAKEYAKVESEWGKSVGPATQAVQRVQAIMTAMKEYETGTWASKKSEIVGMLKSVGINLGNAVDDPAQAQIILKNNFGTALNIMQSTGLSRWTQAELFGAQANSANPELWAKANHAIGAQTIGVIDWEQQMLKDYREYKKYDPMTDPQDFQQRWVEVNPLQAYVDRAHQKIGPLKGEPAAAADVPVLKTPDELKTLRPGAHYARPGDPAGSYRVVPQPGR